MKKVIIYGGGGHAETVLEYVRGPHLLGIVDSKLLIGTQVMHTEVIANDLDEIEWTDAYNCVGGIISMRSRRDAFRRLIDNGHVVSFTHPSAIVEPSSYLISSVHLMAGCYIGSCASLGLNCIINTNAVVSHDCHIGQHTHICPGAILAGNVTIGSECIIGMGVTIYAGVTIGNNIKIYNGTHVFKDILAQDQVPVPGRKN